MLLLRNSTSYGLAHTSSFRRASKQIFGEWGSNLQNPAKKCLRIYQPLPGRVFVQADQAGAEALVVAYLTPKGRFRELFLNGIKSHTYVASHLFSKKWADLGFTDIDKLNTMPIPELAANPRWKTLADIIKNSDTEYFIGKKSCHSFNYRMRPSTFREDVLKESEGEVALSKVESEIFYGMYHDIFPEISGQWWPMLEEQVRSTGYLFNLFGYPRYCQGPYNEKTWRELTAFVPQSTVGCISGIAFCDMQDFIEENGLESEWHLVNEKHDSVMTEVPEDDAMINARVLKASLEQDLVGPHGDKFRMKAEVSIGRNWAKYDEKHNPEGMREIKL